MGIYLVKRPVVKVFCAQTSLSGHSSSVSVLSESASVDADPAATNPGSTTYSAMCRTKQGVFGADSHSPSHFFLRNTEYNVLVLRFGLSSIDMCG